jgi:hypothetical protein
MDFYAFCHIHVFTKPKREYEFSSDWREDSYVAKIYNTLEL